MHGAHHPAYRAGASAGRAAAIEDQLGRLGRGVGAELVMAARESAADWAEGNARFNGPDGAGVALYERAYLAAYDAWQGWAAPPGR